MMTMIVKKEDDKEEEQDVNDDGWSPKLPPPLHPPTAPLLLDTFPAPLPPNPLPRALLPPLLSVQVPHHHRCHDAGPRRARGSDHESHPRRTSDEAGDLCEIRREMCVGACCEIRV